MRKPSIPERESQQYTHLMMNQVTLKRIQLAPQKMIVRCLGFLLVFVSFSALSIGCITPGTMNDSYYTRNPNNYGYYQRNYHSPYYERSGRYGTPYYGGTNQFHMPSSGGGHNPLHVPGGRYHNLGSPGKWRL
ncbi:MAG: hypothetical protein IBJ01_15910 [Leptospira sp.]|uniref:hypothetical protein n=1 Tax=Leptospira sp. TaxID=178 RepID=UPI0025BC2218|nr:hypothetical protein [Leptospira sp.]MBL0956245.1 hypothetical protein [Leptospira sp.]